MYRVVKIEKIVEETPTIKTFFFRDDASAIPGQFYMVWLPGIDEFPMSISYIKELKAFTVKKVGEGTRCMHKLKVGDKLWIRGPYGRGFKITDKKALFVGGGSGMATLAPLIDELPGDVVIAARTEKELLFHKRFRGRKIYLATDDGSKGFKGLAHELVEKLLEKEKYEIIYTCGPEIMIIKLVDIAVKRGIDIQASLERLMKCGIGICDSCSINGFRVCVDGPVFMKEELIQMNDLGKFKRDKSGRKVLL